MSFNAGNAGLQRSLAIGGAPTTTGAAAAARAGVRPVALQPLSSAGGGRVLTGEGLYAEAARSLGALNQGSAKQALFDAQLRDVDGSPLGAAGDPRKAAARIGSQGTVPDSRFSYTNQKPWWWDMMNERSQKMWELWNYNWQKALSDSLIKVSTNLAMCLLTGSENGSVSKFLGAKPGDDEDICVDDNGVRLMADSKQAARSGNKGDSKEGNNASVGSDAEWFSQCTALGGHSIIDPGGKKNALQTRMECLGLKTGKLSWLSGTQYTANCDSVNQTPMVYEASAMRKADGKIRANKQDKIVVYVKAKGRKTSDGKEINGGKEFLVAVEKTNKYTLSESQLADINNKCEITRIGSFKAKGSKKNIDNKAKEYGDLSDSQIKDQVNNLLASKKAGSSQEDAAFNDDIDRQVELLKKRYTNVNTYKESSEDIEIPAHIRGQVSAQYNYCAGNNSAPAKFIDEDNLQKDIKEKTEIGTVCPIWHADGYIKTATADGLTCTTVDEVTELDIAEDTVFTADIKEPKDNIFAIFVEYVQGGQYATGGSNGSSASQPGAVVKEIVVVMKKGKLGSARQEDLGNGLQRFTVTMRPGKAVASTDEQTKPSAPGNGSVFWIMTNANTPTVRAGEILSGKTLSEVEVDDLIGPVAGRKGTKCHYKWGCNTNECKKNTPDAPNGYCVDNEQLFKAYNFKGKYIKTSETPVSDEELKADAEKCPDCNADISKFKEKFADRPCAPICKYLEDSLDQFAFQSDKRTSFPTPEAIKQVLAGCTVCNPSRPNYDIDYTDCGMNLGDTFISGKFINTSGGNVDEAIREGAKRIYNNCIVPNRGFQINIKIDGYTDRDGSFDANGKYLGPEKDKNIPLSEARALTIAKKLREALNAINADLPVGYTFQSKGGTGFNLDNAKAGGERGYIDAFAQAQVTVTEQARSKQNTAINSPELLDTRVEFVVRGLREQMIAYAKGSNSASEINRVLANLERANANLEKNPMSALDQRARNNANSELDSLLSELETSLASEQDKETFKSIRTQYNKLNTSESIENDIKNWLKATYVELNVEGHGINPGSENVKDKEGKREARHVKVQVVDRNK